MTETVCLVTGANRGLFGAINPCHVPSSTTLTIHAGLGRGLIQALLLRPRTTVIAAVRDPAAPSAKSLLACHKSEGNKLIIEKIDASVRTDALDAIRRLQTDHSIFALDIVIAAAGISNHHGLVHEVSIQEVADHIETNALGPLLLYQAAKPLLDAAATAAGINDASARGSGRQPKFVAISSIVSSITNIGSFLLPNTPYGSSKAALNFIMRKIHYENPTLTVLTLHPG